jgi:hypothetical protein
MNAGFTPQPALPPSYAGDPAGATISSRAYGIASQGTPGGGSTTAAYGSMAVTAVSTLALVWLWWTLPR